MNAIECHRLTRHFDRLVAVADLDLAIPAGTIFGFLGPNGAGKTTTVRMLCALIAPSSGTARVAGFDVQTQAAAVRAVTGILTETPGLYDTLSALENLTFFARLYGLSATQAAERAAHYLRLFELWERRNDPVGGFSKGMRQKLAIARALLHDPAVVFLDEPTAGLDPAAARAVRDVIKTLRAGGRTIFLTTHNLAEADELCDLIGVFRTRLISLDTPANLRARLFGQSVRVVLAGPAAPLAPLVQQLPFVSGVDAEERVLLVRLANPDQHNPALVRALVAAGADVCYLEPFTPSLETVYLELMQEAVTVDSAS
ncbi:multidrug ABC transporter ATP-binding protein [Chloroflexus islandicus]|uniref:Multidrug ABC transporter ATP-binding protein n=1 Tax=Chloroflexus islandicus TaxID=1707952 RepID=A0A178M8N4_9CHLR|nr:ABC transporter ATP-binding protein [Chloroflexus islandicus]OAN44254.1 multidrug ABC transporter ATP-binding protein [Chloroflexus islandicus]